MSNSVLDLLKQFQGKPLSGSPSPVTVWLNGILKQVELGVATVEYTVRREMTNPLGTLQGGIFTTMMDDTLGVAVYSLGKDKLYTTVNFNVDYLESARQHDHILVTAMIRREGSTILNVEIIAKNKDGKTLAYGTSNLVAKNIDGFKLPGFKEMKNHKRQ